MLAPHWSGVSADGTSSEATTNCNDWSAAPGTGTTVDATGITAIVACDEPHPLLCAEDI